MIKTPRLQSEQPAALRVSLTSGGIGPFVLPEAQHFSLELTRAELDALIDGLCACASPKVSNHRPRCRRQCQQLPRQWCRLAERAGAGPRPLETRFG